MCVCVCGEEEGREARKMLLMEPPQTSVLLSFFLHTQWLVAFLVAADKDDGMFVNTAFNQTITLTDPETEGSFGTLLTYAAIAAAAAFFYMKNKDANANGSSNGSKGSKASSNSKKVSQYTLRARVEGGGGGRALNWIFSYL